jgi:hypothetical protein
MDPQAAVAVYLTAVMVIMVALAMIGGHKREKREREDGKS